MKADAKHIRTRVSIDGDRDLRFVVTGVMTKGTGGYLEVSHVFNGELRAAWVEDWRCSAVPEDAT